MIKKVSNKLANWLVTKSYNEDKYEIVVFGLEYILSSIVSIGSILFIGWAIGLFKEVTVFLLTAIPFRWLSGGAHSSTFWGCYWISIITSIGFPLFSQYQLFDIIHSEQWTIGIALFSSILMFLFAPSNAVHYEEEKSIRLLILRLGSIAYPYLWYLVATKLLDDSVLYQVSMCGLAWQTFTTTPFGYFTFKRFDRLKFFT
ncbi:hypothetical protein GTO91_17515 [Heliobacterium undosum]|uniref:Accessory gene regulator B n=1 Tax=Heliomicrobium undosum TaxID=121734 RepID=A0A845L4A0_9FIRM|nr:accessory gene regulator B family protein [Heliomicrobium undosum]MZP31482.1 hypothetical protein [Heliomicrobium undosum]